MASENIDVGTAKPEQDREFALQKTPQDIVGRWLRELDAADKHEKKWREQAEKVIKLYKDDKGASGDESNPENRFNILFSNTEVLKGALYSQCPAPDVRRRFIDRDPVGRIGALVLVRALIAQLDKQTDGEDFDSVMKDSVFDMVLPGRASARVKYIPSISKSQKRVCCDAMGNPMPEGTENEPGEGGQIPEVEGAASGELGDGDNEGPMDGTPAHEQPEQMAEGVEKDENGYFRMEDSEEVVYECVEAEYIEWAYFRMSPAKRWKKVRWVAWGELLTRDDLIDQFGEDIGGKVELKWMPKGAEDTAENQILKRALVWTIWNKTDRKVYVVSDGYKDAPLSVVDDPLRLEQFFPVPRPLYSIFTTDSLIPVPEYTVYQDHAIQLDTINERIAVLTDALRRRGVYDSAFEELVQLAKGGDNQFFPVKNYREFVEKGGLEQLFQELDITGLAAVLRELMLQSDAKKAQIYEIIGISDIMRGTTRSSETLGAQQIKNQWGSIRVQPRQAEVQRYARDLIRLMAEIIAEHFSAQTLAIMTGIQLAFTVEERAQIAQTAPDDPRVKRPTWDDVLRVLRSDKLRGFRVDIETDSTIRQRADEEQKNRVDLITAVTGFLEKALPAVQQGMMPKKVAGELLMFGVRAFPAGPQLEEVLDEWAFGGATGDGEGEGQPGQPDPAQAAQAAQQAEQQKQAQHMDALRQLEIQTKTALMVQEKAKAYQEITKGEAMAPDLQLGLLSKQAELAGIMDPQPQAALAPAQPAPQPAPGGAPGGAMVQ